MPDFVTAVITAVGLIFVIEGVLYALFPEAMKRILWQVLELPTNVIRTAGLVAALVGLGVVWLARG